MKSIYTFLFLFAACALSAATQGIYDEYKNGVQYNQIDTVMNEVRFDTSNRANVYERVNVLTEAINAHPDYPHLGQAYYFLGAHQMQIDSYSDALESFNKARKLNPGLDTRTPILTYLTKSQENLKKQTIYRITTSVLLSIIIFSVLIMFKTKSYKYLPRKSAAVIVITSITLLAVVVVISMNVESDQEVLSELFTPPVLTLSGTTTAYSQPLWLLIGYGTAAIVLSLFIACSTAGLTNKSVKYIISPLFSVVAAASLMTLFYMNECYDNAQRTGNGIGTQFHFLEKLILWHHEVPDEMIHLYDKDLQHIIRDAKKKKEEEEK